MFRTVEFVAIAAMLSCAAGIVRADEQVVPLAINGDWAAAEYRPSMITPPDVCLLTSGTGHIALRADSDAVQFRVVNDNWALPAHVSGDIAVTVGNWTTTLTIDDSTDTMVNAEIDKDVVVPMLNAMDKANSMSVTVGKAKSFQVSLAGSMRAANAFRTCARIPGATNASGANPFE